MASSVGWAACISIVGSGLCTSLLLAKVEIKWLIVAAGHGSIVLAALVQMTRVRGATSNALGLQCALLVVHVVRVDIPIRSIGVRVAVARPLV